ncbi:Retrotransposon gag domain-containing protein [Camponotus japonicus]
MEAHARAPEPLVKTNDMASNWHTWKEDFIIFMKVTGYINKPNDIRANLLKNRIGKIGIDAIQTMTFDKPEDKDDMDILIEKLEEFFNPPKNEVVERFQFFTRDKKHNETIEQYINILKEKAKTCNFNELTDSIIRDKIILITQDKILRKKFFETKNLDLQKLVAIYNDYSINIEKMKQLTKENINMEKKQITKESTENINFTPKPLMNDTRKKCWRCNCQHPLGKCPAWGSKCTKCGDVNHFTQCCKGPRPNPNKLNDNKINNLLNPLDQANVNLAQANIPKNNKKKNYLANSETKNMDPMNNMTSFPDIPTVPCDAANSTFNSDKFDFVMLDECKPGPSLPSDNTTNRPAYLNHTQYNNAYVRRAKPTGTTHLLDISPTPDGIRRELTKIKEGMKSELKHLDQKIIDTAVRKVESDLIRDLHGSTEDRKKLDKDPCVLS